jgi:putative salt-induced outer membrane protein YdiY
MHLTTLGTPLNCSPVMESLPLKKHILSIICLYSCVIWPANAEEQTAADSHITDQTIQAPLIDADPEPAQEHVIIEPLTMESPAEEEIDTPDGNNITQTPQPPVITQQAQPVYEPEAEADADDSTSGENIITPGIQTIQKTPQPPVVDKPVEPSYEPVISESITNIDDSDDTAISKQQDTPPASNTGEEQTAKWLDTRPRFVNADWLQLTSGEWLRGRIIAMQKNTLEFDSDELKILEIEWKKVKYIKSYDPYSLRFIGRILAAGAIEITEDKIYIITDYDDQTFDRSKLVSIASGKETEISRWTSKATFSINVRRGNTDQTDFASRINAKRRTTDSRLTLDYLGSFSQVENTETVNSHRLNGNFDYFITRDLFWTLASFEYYRDPFQNIEKRLNLGTAMGYTIINTNDSEWDISAGPSYQETTFVSVQPGEPISDRALTLILSTNFDTELNSKVDLEGLYSATLGDETTGNYSHHSILTIETEITDKLDFDVSGVWDRVRQPVPDENNITPDNNDFKILIGLGYEL